MNNKDQAVSLAPDGASYSLPGTAEENIYFLAARKRALNARSQGQQIIVVQGLGFVGSAVSACIADARDENGSPLFFVLGVDTLRPSSFWKIAKLRQGQVPFPSPDQGFASMIERAVLHSRNLAICTGTEAYTFADVIVVDIGLDIETLQVCASDEIRADMSSFEDAIRCIGQHMRPDTLVMVETTVPLGTCETIVVPILQEERKKRDITAELLLSHAYERVMPGPRYIDSIRKFWRTYSGINAQSEERTQAFLSRFIATQDYPLRRLGSPTASEMAKLLENSYRAMNIAFIHEWTLLAEQAGVNLFEVIESIRVRQGTHDNMRYPGFGVGGYCLTKDSLLAQWGAIHLLGASAELTMTLHAIRVNYTMPEHTLNLLADLFDQNLTNKVIAVLGLSYLPEVGDERNSPTTFFVKKLKERGAQVLLHDPYLAKWERQNEFPIIQDLAEVLNKAQAVVFAVPHQPYKDLIPSPLCQYAAVLSAVVDTQNMISDTEAIILRKAGLRLAGVGKGHWRKMNYQEKEANA